MREAGAVFIRTWSEHLNQNNQYMKGYIIAEVQIHDAVRYENYKKLTPASLEHFGGRFIVRGGGTESLEGGWTPGRVVVIEFPSPAQAKAWWASDDYAPAKALRQATAHTRMLLVEGVAP
jgi:uncharacterized protein (DUF1330 family)